MKISITRKYYVIHVWSARIKVVLTKAGNYFYNNNHLKLEMVVKRNNRHQSYWFSKTLCFKIE